MGFELTIQPGDENYSLKLKNRFLCETPDGADFISCPKCETYSRTTLSYDENLKDECNENEMKYIRDCDIMSESEDEDEEEDESLDRDMRDIKYNVRYCIRCKMIFELGPTFLELGCTSSIYNAYIVSNFTFRGQKYHAIPLFKSHTHWKKLVTNKKIKFNWGICLNKHEATYIEIANLPK